MTLRYRLNQIYGSTSRERDSALGARLERIERRKFPAVSMAGFLRGEWQSGTGGQVLRVCRDYPLFHCHGIRPLAPFLKTRGSTLGLLANEPRFDSFDPERILFLDTETTGLAGGAGTYVFLVGAGYFREGQFRVRQIFLPDYSSEQLFLEALAKVVDGDDGPSFRQLVSFNGKSYDLNLLANRLVLKRLPNPFEGLCHLDLIHPCRTLWKGKVDSCSLQSLERRLLGFVRREDIPSHLIPQTYFRFLRSGHYRSFGEVFEHNRLDILSMVALVALAAAVVEDPIRHRFADPFSAARLHQLRGRIKEAAWILQEAIRKQPAASGRLDWIRELAFLKRRLGRPDESLDLWREYLRNHSHPGREAFEEAAKILEHQSKDFKRALLAVQRGLRLYPSDAALQHRRHRLQCKLEGRRWWGEPAA